MAVIALAEVAYPHDLRHTQLVNWALELLCIAAEKIIADVASEGTEEVAQIEKTRLFNVWDALHRRFAAAAHDYRIRGTPVFDRSSALLNQLFDRISQFRTPCTYHHISYFPDDVSSLYLSLDGTRLVTGGDDGVVRAWTLSDHQNVAIMRGHTSQVTSVAFSADGTRIASGSSDKTVRIWDAKTGAEHLVMRGHDQRVTCVAFSPTGRMVVSGSWDQKAIIWNSTTGQRIHTLTGHTDWISSATFSGDELQVATGGDDCTVRIWDTKTGSTLKVIHTQHGDWIRHVDFVAGGSHILSRSQNWEQKYWRAPDYDAVQGPSQLEETGLKLALPLFTFDPHTHYLLCWTSQTRVFQPVMKLPEDMVLYADMFYFTGHTLVFQNRPDLRVFTIDCSPMFM